MNNLTIAGNISQEAEMKYLPNGDAVATFSVADNMGKDKGAIFWRCSLFGKRAESLSQYLLKGSAVTVSGSVTEREWTDKEGGKRKSMDVRVQDIALQGGRKDSAPAPQQAPQRQAQKPAPSGFDDMDSDVPF